MNIVKIHGGLGNQMFQFAFGKYIEYVTNKTISFDLSWFDNCCSDRPYLLPIAFDLNINQRLSRISSSKHLKYLCKYIHPKQAAFLAFPYYYSESEDSLFTDFARFAELKSCFLMDIGSHTFI